MTLRRARIRKAVVAGLQGANLAYGPSVEATRIAPWISSPGVSVYTLSDNLEIESEAPRGYAHELDLEVQIWIKGTGSVDDKLDEIAEDIEKWMAANETLRQSDGSCLVGAMTLRSTTGEIDDADAKYMALTLAYSVKWSEDAFVDDEVLPDFDELLITATTPESATVQELVQVSE